MQKQFLNPEYVFNSGTFTHTVVEVIACVQNAAARKSAAKPKAKAARTPGRNAKR